jgi:hypothetical protein
MLLATTPQVFQRLKIQFVKNIKHLTISIFHSVPGVPFVQKWNALNRCVVYRPEKRLSF